MANGFKVKVIVEWAEDPTLGLTTEAYTETRQLIDEASSRGDVSRDALIENDGLKVTRLARDQTAAESWVASLLAHRDSHNASHPTITIQEIVNRTPPQ
jgi:hypothetical protein